jgi:hypothetical protein
MNRRDLALALAAAGVAALVLAFLGDNELLPSAAAAVACGLIVAGWLAAVRRLTASGAVDRIAAGRWTYLTVPVYGLLGASFATLLPRLLELGSGIRIAAGVVGALAGTYVGFVEARDRRAQVRT